MSSGIIGLLAVVAVVVIGLLLLISCVKIVPQARAMVVDSLGAYQATWSTGLHFKVPIIDRVARRGLIRWYSIRSRTRRCFATA